MTAQELIDSSLGDIGVLAPGEAVSADDSAFCLSKLNLLIASLSAQALPIYQITRDSLGAGGVEAYNIGPGMTWNTPRPVKIKAGASVYGGHSEPLAIVTAEDWAKIADKSLAGSWAKLLYYNNGYPTGIVYLWPKPAYGGTVQLDSYKELATFATPAIAIALPPGYERLLVNLLSVEIAGAFGKPITEAMVGLATDAKTSVFGLNQAILGNPGGQPAVQAPVQAPVQ